MGSKADQSKRFNLLIHSFYTSSTIRTEQIRTQHNKRTVCTREKKPKNPNVVFGRRYKYLKFLFYCVCAPQKNHLPVASDISIDGIFPTEALSLASYMASFKFAVTILISLFLGSPQEQFFRRILGWCELVAAAENLWPTLVLFFVASWSTIFNSRAQDCALIFMGNFWNWKILMNFYSHRKSLREAHSGSDHISLFLF